MAADLQKQIERVKAKAQVLSEKYYVLQDNYTNARNEISHLKAEALARESQIEKLQVQVEYLTVASTVKATGDDIEATRAMIADLVREIDRCIKDLLE